MPNDQIPNYTVSGATKGGGEPVLPPPQHILPPSRPPPSLDSSMPIVVDHYPLSLYTFDKKLIKHIKQL